jgi:hypothetical protein
VDLTSYRGIAFDLDGTLIDCVNTAVRDYVLSQPDQKFNIVTFRTQAEGRNVAQELEASGLDIGRFAQIVFAPDRLVREFREDQQMRRSAGLPMLGRSTVNLLEGEHKYVHWKGFITRKLGCQLLVDDMAYLTRPGCEKYKVEFIDAHDFPTVHNATIDKVA